VPLEKVPGVRNDCSFREELLQHAKTVQVYFGHLFNRTFRN